MIIFAIALCSCSSTIELDGLDNFSIYDCKVELTVYLLPSETFLSDYTYSQGDYYFYEYKMHPKAFIYLQYDLEEYTQAKAYCFSRFALVEDNRHEFGGYCFIENNTYHDSKNESSWYPKWFNMFGYNDETQTLFFLGYYNGSISDEDKALATTDFSGFLIKHFGEYYDFSA